MSVESVKSAFEGNARVCHGSIQHANNSCGGITRICLGPQHACYNFPCLYEPDKYRQVASVYRRTTQIAISSAMPMTDAQTTRSAKMITTAMASATVKIHANAMQTMTRTATVFVRTRMIVHLTPTSY